MLLSVRSFAKQLAVSAFVLSAGFAMTAQAQTAPTLIPYTAKLIAGGSSTATPASGGTCPISGYKTTDAYGDGCLATEIQLGNVAAGNAKPGARAAVADSQGNVFFTDYANNLVRRVDALTGIVTAVAGGATASPATGVACGTLISVDAHGDGCLGTAVKLSSPAAIAFSPAGDLYFSEYGSGDVRKIAATAGFITTSGVITNVAGSNSGTYGYIVSNATTTINAATASALDAPYGLAFDNKGDLFIAEEYKNAVLVVNLNATGSTTVNGVTVPAGSIWKIFGASTVAGNAPYCPNGTSGTFGCSYAKYTEGSQANLVSTDGPYDVAVDSLGNTYVANEFYNTIPVIAPSGVLTTFAGSLSSELKEPNTKRGVAGTFGIGSTVGVTVDSSNDVYLTDPTAGLIWRVDATTKNMYAVAGGGTVCAGATDAYGDGCPALQTTLGSNGTTYSSFTLPGPGVFHVSVDGFENLYFGDTEYNVVREIASGTQFGAIGNTQPTNTLEIHFAPGDGPASATPYVITAGMNNFALGTPGACTVNSDSTQDCLVPLQATPAVLGAFTGTLTVKSALGATATFPLTGTYVTSRVTRLSLALSAATSCTGTNYSTSTVVTVTATINSTGTPTGTVQFYNNGVAFGQPQPVSSGTATLSQAFPAGSYSITAVYSGDTNFNSSTASTPVTFSTQASSFSLATVSNQEPSVTAGGTALYSFTVPESVYGGSITFSCSGLPSGASCVFSPVTITGTGCSLVGTAAPVVSMSIYTSAQGSTLHAGFTGRWLMLSGFLLAMFVGFGRRRMPARFAQFSLMLALLLGASGLTACSSGTTVSPATPSGSYTIAVTAAGSNGVVQATSVNLTVK